MKTWLLVKLSLFRFKLSMKVFKWVQDEDGDVGLQVCGLVTFIKYKDMTVILWGRKKQRELVSAPRWVRAA